MKYNYKEEMTERINEYIQMNYLGKLIEINNSVDESEKKDRIDTLYETLYDELWVEDYVTGNGSGSYTFNRSEAREYVLVNMELAVEAYDEFGELNELTKDMKNEDWERIDVTIRCYLLSGCINNAIEEGMEIEGSEIYDEEG